MVLHCISADCTAVRHTILLLWRPPSISAMNVSLLGSDFCTKRDNTHTHATAANQHQALEDPRHRLLVHVHIHGLGLCGVGVAVRCRHAPCRSAPTA